MFWRCSELDQCISICSGHKMRSWIRNLALCSACRGHLPRLGSFLSPVTTWTGVTLHPAAGIPIRPTVWCSSARTHRGWLGINPRLPSWWSKGTSANYWASLYLDFLICKMGIETGVFSHIWGEDWMRSCDHVFSLAPCLAQLKEAFNKCQISSLFSTDTACEGLY